MLAFLVLYSGAWAATPLTIGSCKTDQDCLSFTLRLHPLATSSAPDSGYSCLDGVCSYVVGAGSICRKSSDCASYSFLQSAITSNRSELLPVGESFASISSYMDSLCNPSACTVQSTCTLNYAPFYPSESSPPQTCCRGIPQGDACVQTGGLVNTCSSLSSCVPTADVLSNAMVCTLSSPPKSTQWIGIMLTLIAAALTNLGLNLQKYALRKRHEKEVKKKENERIGLFYRLTNLKMSVSNFYRSVSNVSLPFSPSAAAATSGVANETTSTLKGDTSQQIPALTFQAATPLAIDHEEETTESGENVTPTRPEVVPLSDESSSDQNAPLGQLKAVNPSDKDQFQSKLDMANLAKNPRWWLGFIVFVIGNFTNFAALNFAAQSLIGPLGSFSLVCNVVIAPWLNGEIWTWKDIVGVFLIVCGSVVVVIFSGSTTHDYNACVLLKLFQKPDTIIFLVFICSIILFVFIYIVVLEKNLDFKEASAVVITETIETGQLVSVEANPHHNSHGERTSRHSISAPNEIRSRHPAGFNGRKRLSMVVSDQIAEDGSNLRILTINTIGGQPDDNTNEDEESDDLTQDVGAGPSTRLNNTLAPPTSPGAASSRIRRPSIPNIAIGGAASELIDADGNTIQALFSKKGQDGESIHSVALTFKIPPPPSPTIAKRNVDVESNISLPSEIAADKVPAVAVTKGETVVILPKSRKEHSRSTWYHKFIETLKTTPSTSWMFTIRLVPRFQKKVSLDSRYVRYGLPFAYATLGGLMATILTLFAKATIYLLTNSFEGDNQFTSFPAYLFTFVTIFSAVSQVYWINMGLARYDALLQIPVFYVVWTLFDVIGGGVFYSEFEGFTTARYALFSLGVGIIFIGVAVLATRLAALADEDKELGM